MSLVTSLLTAIVRADGDALVLHAGERPYVVAPTGQSELASRALTLDAMRGMLKELLPADAQHTLVDIGAVQQELAPPSFARAERFTVIAARGGDDIWIEIRRHRAPKVPKVVVAAPVVAAMPAPAPPVAPAEVAPPQDIVTPIEVAAPAEVTMPADVAAQDHQEPAEPEPAFELSAQIDTPSIEEVEEEELETRREPQPELALEAQAEAEPEVEAGTDTETDTETETETWNIELTSEDLDVATEALDVEATLDPNVELEPNLELEPNVELEPEQEPEPEYAETSEVHEISLDADFASMIVPPTPEVVVEPAAVVEPAPAAIVAPDPTPEPVPEIAASRPEPAPVPVESKRPIGPVEVPAPASVPRTEVHEPEPRSAVVLPLSRPYVRVDQPARFSPPDSPGIDRLLRIAAARGASTLYLMSQARPSIRVDGEIRPIDGEAALGEPDVEALILDIIPERNREALRSQAGTEWICDVPDVGRIRCMTFRDHRGAGGIFRMIPALAISAEQLGLSREIQGLCAEAEGLLLVTGPRSSGKSTLIAAFVDLINRTRSDHVITIENQIKFVHENRTSLVSQREVRGDRNELLLVARSALRENPDVLVIEDFGSPEIVTLALEAAQSGHLVIGALTAHTATDAVDRIIDETPPDRRQKVQMGLAENLRGIVAQVLLRKPGGGRVAAREVLLNTRAVSNVIAEGKTSQLPMAIDSGRKHGMVALNDVLAAFVQGGVVDSREAYRRAADHQGFLALLKRQGIDTSFVERLA